jgi:uncharacterized membrane-anchored protein YitT (DUF2179 family)
MALPERTQLLETGRRYLLYTLGALIAALNYIIFISPTRIAPGGAAGVTLLVNHFTGVPEGAILFGIQLLMIAIGSWHLGGAHFVTRTLYVSFLYSLLVTILQPMLPDAGITDDLLLNAIYGGILGGIGLGIIYAGHGNVAGTSVISRLVQLKTGIPLSQIYIFVDGSILLLQGLTFGWEKALYGMLMLFIWGMAVDYVQEGPSVVRTVFVVTSRPKQIAGALQKLRIGVTSWPVTGMFTDKNRVVLFCTINRSDVAAIKGLIQINDPHAFTVIGQGHQAIGGMVRGIVKES